MPANRSFVARSGKEIRVVFSSIVSITPIWRAAAQPIAEVGVAAFLVSGLTFSIAGAWSPWIVLATCALGMAVRAADMEAWALLVPGGARGYFERAFGERFARAGAAIALAERLLFAALAALIIGSYVTNAPIAAAFTPLTRHLTTLDVSTLLAVLLVAFFWVRSRMGLTLHRQIREGLVWAAFGIVTIVVVWAVLTRPAGVFGATAVTEFPIELGTHWWTVLMSVLAAIAVAIPVASGGDMLARTANTLPLPRLPVLRRIARLSVLVSLVTVALPTFLFAKLILPIDQSSWTDLPLIGIAHHVAGSHWGSVAIDLLIAAAAAVILGPAAHAALTAAAQSLRRFASDRVLPDALGDLHVKFGTPARSIDVSAAATVLILVASAGRLPWLGHAYALVLAILVLVNVASLIRLRSTMPDPRAFAVPLNLRLGRRQLPLGLFAIGLVVAAAALALVIHSAPGSLAPLALVGGLVALVLRPGPAVDIAPEVEPVELLPAGELSLDHVHARPGGVLVAVRNRLALDHLVRALQTSDDRDVVVLTVRVLDVDASESDAGTDTHLTRDERTLFAAVVAAAEHAGRTVELLAVPAPNVFDGVMATAIRLRSSEIHVGESASLTAEAQAQILGESWEAATKPQDLAVRLIVHHRTGRSDTYHVGAHPPNLTPSDLDLIHRLWLDVSKHVGSDVHHHDIVRAALTKMEEQLTGSEREGALALVRHVARPSDELTSALRDRDFARLRDITRNRPASDLAEILTSLSVEEQVVAFRLLPRKQAAEVFEYLSLESQEALVKGMAQEDIAALLNDMAPDDRTRFLEELPAAVTRQLLALLTPAERSVALTLLGYPPDSVGRLMTPHYVAVREHWTIQDVLDYIRQHGQDSETLNVIYVIDENGLLIDDIRTREVLLTSPDRRISDIMDRRTVGLKATDDQEAAVAAFRQYDRTALPVTDTAGALIGIVTIDDVLDVAEAEATKDIQRIGGMEALDEPYTEIAFGGMIRKRAGWLTALFLGEMLTATAMKAFEAEIARAVVLALFVPLIISSGGNSGSQASTLVVRALALGELTLADWWKVIRREFLVGLTLGGILGVIGFLRITVWDALSPGAYGPHAVLLAVAVSVTLVSVVLWGTLVGSFLPLVLRRLGFDPATSSAPFVATLVDVTGLVIYFTVALVILRGTLL